MKLKKALCPLLAAFLCVPCLFSACDLNFAKPQDTAQSQETEKPQDTTQSQETEKPQDPQTPDTDKEYKTVVDSHATLGCGGYGAVFNAAIDPFNGDCFGATCDMGSVYFSFNKGESWTRHNIQGTVYCLKYDPSAEGVVWVAGSGVYKSTDHGRTMKMVFPKEEEVTSAGNNYENANYWIYTDKASDYAPHYQIWSMAIDRKSQGKHVFAAQRIPGTGLGYNECIRVYETTDGENFHLFSELEYSYNYKIDYDESNDCLVYVTPSKILEINANREIAYTVNEPVAVQFINGNNMSFHSYYNKVSGRNTFIFSSPQESEHAKNACYITQDLRNRNAYTEITSELVNLTTDDFGVKNLPNYQKNRPSYEYCEYIGSNTVPQQFKWTISDVHAQSENVFYLFHEATTPTYNTDGSLYINRRTQVYLKYDARKNAKERFSWVYGMPLKPYDQTISNRSWQDSDSAYCLGMTASPTDENILLYCSNVGIYYTEDGDKVKQLDSKIFGSDELTFTSPDGQTAKKNVQRVNSTGMDVICTHTLATDPYDSNHLIMGCTDIGMLQSYDNGASWYRALYEWQNGTLKDIKYASYTNTCFDVHFDKGRRNVVYGLWSLTKTAPTSPNDTYLTGDARFGVSCDGGLSWTMTNITADGKCQPYQMQIVYEGSEPVFYISTDGNGFFVSRDRGKSFTAMNAGLDTATTKSGKTAIWANELLVCKQGIFAITGGAATEPDYQMFYKWNNSLQKFEKIGLPQSEYESKQYTPAAVRDIVYDEKNDCLYLSCTANVISNKYSLIQRAGGIWKYKNGEFTQIYDEKISVLRMCLDSTGRLYAAELGGRIIRYDNNNTTHEVILDGLFHRLKNICFGANDNILYVSTWGGSTERVILKQVEI